MIATARTIPLVVLTVLLCALPACAACPGSNGASTPVTVDDETGAVAASRQLVNGTGTVIDTTTAGKIKVNLTTPLSPTFFTYSAGGVAAPGANTYTNVTNATQVNLPGTGAIDVGAVIGIGISGAQGNTSIVTNGGAGDEAIIFNGSTTSGSIQIKNGESVELVNLGSGKWLVSVFTPQVRGASAGANSDITSLSGLTTPLSVSQGGTGAATLSAHGVLLGTGTGAVSTAGTGTAGQVLTSNGAGADPTWQTGGSGSGDMLLGAVQTVTGAKTFQHQTLKVSDSDNSHAITIQAGNEGANRTLSMPSLGADDVIITAGTAQTITGNKTFSGTTDLSGGLNAPLTVANGGTGVTTGARVFGGFAGTSLRALPTSGTLTGAYFHVGNWTSTGAITCNRCSLHVIGTFTLSHALAVNTELKGGFGSLANNGGSSGNGSGLGAGNAQNSSELHALGGGGGGYGGMGGNGGTSVAYDRGGRGGVSYNIDHQLCGSSGAGGRANSLIAGATGGEGGGGIYIEASGSITIDANITADGGDGGAAIGTNSAGGGGGSGGGIDIRSLGAVTINSGRTIFARGGAGGDGAASGAAGGGGAGGYVAIHGSTVTNNGTVTVTGGAGGSGTSPYTPTAGGSGVTSIQSEIWGPRMVP